MVHFPQQVLQWRQIEIAFEQGRKRAYPPISLGEQRPYRIDDIGPVGIHLEVLRFVVMPRHVDVPGPLQRQSIEERQWIVAMVDAVNVDVIDVQQQVAATLGKYRIDKLRLAQLEAGTEPLEAAAP